MFKYCLVSELASPVFLRLFSREGGKRGKGLGPTGAPETDKCSVPHYPS